MIEFYVWYDMGKSRTMDEVVADGLLRYEQKFGLKGTQVHVHSDAEVKDIPGVQIVKRKSVRPHQVWVTDGST